MTTNSISPIASAPFAGLGTVTYNIPATGRYRIEVGSTLPWQTNDAPGALANPAAQEIQNVTLVADSSGSLNSTFWTFYTAGNTNGYYVWYNINSAGVDPAPAGLTGIAVAGATNVTAANLATATRTAIAAAVSSSLVTVSGATTHVILTNMQIGTCTAAANGTASPGFSYSITTTGSYGQSSGLKTVVSQNSTVLYTLSNPSPSQRSLSGSVTQQLTAADVITVVFSSSAYVDALPNAVKSIVNLYLVKG